MNASFADIHAAADFIGQAQSKFPLYQTEIIDICRRSSPFGQRIKQVPATGHPSRFSKRRRCRIPVQPASSIRAASWRPS